MGYDVFVNRYILEFLNLIKMVVLLIDLIYVDGNGSNKEGKKWVY